MHHEALEVQALGERILMVVKPILLLIQWTSSLPMHSCEQHNTPLSNSW